MTTSHPSTASDALDSIADVVLSLVRATPRQTNQGIADTLFRVHAVRVSPDNLRVWLARRYASQFRATVAPAVRSNLDQHLDLVNELLADGYVWRQVLTCLQGIDPEVRHTPEGLRSWYSRRVRRGAKVATAGAAAARGAESLAAGRASLQVTQPSIVLGPVTRPTATAQPSSPALTPAQRAAAELEASRSKPSLADDLRAALVDRSTSS